MVALASASSAFLQQASADWSLWKHQQRLQIRGIHVPQFIEHIIVAQRGMYREFRLHLETTDAVPSRVSLKLPAVEAERTPYRFEDGTLFFQGQPLLLSGLRVDIDPIPPAEDPWHLKGYTFPWRGTANPFYELRINPRITGHCPGRCVFCHRTHSHRIPPTERTLTEPREIVARIQAAEGNDVLREVHRVMLISELFGNEANLLDTVEKTREALAVGGYPADREFNCCAQDVRSLQGLERLRGLVAPKRYTYTLECFSNRAAIMGKYKGVPMREVLNILTRARAADFDEIQLNYIAGLDSLDDMRRGFEGLVARGLVDSVGLSTYTVFWTDGWRFRCPEGWETDYYLETVSSLDSLGIRIFGHDSYDMPLPYAALMRKALS